MAGFVGGREHGLLGAIEGLSELRLRVNRALVPLLAGDKRAGDKGYLKGGEIYGLLTYVVARERGDEVIDRKAHCCADGAEGRGGSRGEGGGEDEVSGLH